MITAETKCNDSLLTHVLRAPMTAIDEKGRVGRRCRSELMPLLSESKKWGKQICCMTGKS